jgi:hypothetical protein
VVVVSRGDLEALESCMGRLTAPCRRFGAEIVIVAPVSSAEQMVLRSRFPAARVVAAPADLGESDLRGLGILESVGDIVAFTEDCELRGEEWLSVLERRSRTDGGYGPTPNGATDWVRYLNERGVIVRNGKGA